MHYSSKHIYHIEINSLLPLLPSIHGTKTMWIPAVLKWQERDQYLIYNRNRSVNPSSSYLRLCQNGLQFSMESTCTIFKPRGFGLLCLNDAIEDA